MRPSDVKLAVDSALALFQCYPGVSDDFSRQWWTLVEMAGLLNLEVAGFLVCFGSCRITSTLFAAAGFTLVAWFKTGDENSTRVVYVCVGAQPQNGMSSEDDRLQRPDFDDTRTWLSRARRDLSTTAATASVDLDSSAADRRLSGVFHRQISSGEGSVPISALPQPTPGQAPGELPVAPAAPKQDGLGLSAPFSQFASHLRSPFNKRKSKFTLRQTKGTS